MSNKKIKVGIDINELIRARSIQFDRYYVNEFGEEGAPKGQPYSYDFFNDYKWDDISEDENILLDDAPEDIDPRDYIVDPKTGVAPADVFLMKKNTIVLTAKEVYERFLYKDFVFEIFASAPSIYPNIELDLDKILRKYSEQVDFILFSKENLYTRPSTFSFLSKTRCRFNEVRLYDNYDDLINGLDIVITTDPELITLIDSEYKYDSLVDDNKSKVVFKADRPYNVNIECDLAIDNLQHLLTDERFKIMVGYEENEINNN